MVLGDKKLDLHVLGFRSMLANQVASTICENIQQSQRMKLSIKKTQGKSFSKFDNFLTQSDLGDLKRSVPGGADSVPPCLSLL